MKKPRKYDGSPKSKLGAETKQYVAESRKTATLPQDELRAVFESWEAPIREAFGVLQQLQRAWADWVEEHSEQIAVIGEFLQNAAHFAGEIAVRADAASKRFAETLAKMERLAQLGWTFPTQLSLAELSDFADLQASAAAESFMLRKFEEADPDFEKLESRLLDDPQLDGFRTVLPQCFRAIRRGDYAVAVPNFMAMLERVILKLNPPNLAAHTDVVKTLQAGGAIAQQGERNLFCATVWLSLATVVTEFWKQYPLIMPGTPMLSRPAIQHGRIEPPNSKGEVLRLLNTLETGLGLHDQLAHARSFEYLRREADNRERIIAAMVRASLYLPRGE